MGNAAAKRPTPSMAVNKSFILYALGISVWMALVSCLGSTYMHPLLPDNAAAGPYVISQQCSYVLSYFVFFILIWRRKFTKVLSFWKVTVCALSGSMVLLAAVITFPNSTLLAISYGIAMGIGITSGYMHWIQMVSERPLKEIVPLLLHGVRCIYIVGHCLRLHSINRSAWQLFRSRARIIRTNEGQRQPMRIYESSIRKRG